MSKNREDKKVKLASIASSSLSAILFPACNTSNISSRHHFSFSNSILLSLKSSGLSSSRILAAPEALESNPDSTSLEVFSSSASIHSRLFIFIFIFLTVFRIHEKGFLFCLHESLG
ncbi:hypothetical protein Pfo_013491 [Paulownia fortunei]|nr:hypothetical protein Pfo_013491 [Paulownia fortunei]